MIYYNVEQSPYSTKGEYFIQFKEIATKYFTPMKGSFNVLNARLFNLSFPQYLRYISEEYNAHIIGKSIYPIIYFENEQDAKNLANELDKRLLYVLKHCGRKQE